MKSANGVIVLVLGILSFVGFGCLTGLPAWLIGNQSLKDIDAGLADPNERGMVQVGRILGIIATLLFAIGIVFVLIAILFLGGLAAVFGSRAH